MQRDSELESATQRSAAGAVVCSLLVPGLGHWYLGALRQGVVIAALYVLAMPALVVLIVALDRGLAPAVWLVIGFSWLLRVLAAMHAAFVAKRVRSVEASKFYTLGACMGFAALGVGLGQISSEVVRKHVLERLVVPATSGRPNIDAGDRLVITKLTARDREARRGDLITFVVPGEMAIFVKRVVATEGETVSVAGGVVSVDGVAFATSPCESIDGLALSPEATCLIERTFEGASYPIQHRGKGDAAPSLVPAGHVFVLGDNRSESHDSRHFGPVSLDAVTGRVRAIWWPSERRSWLDP
jgi:signal peptidase I